MSPDDTDADRTGRREDGTIVVPMRMYKGITVFSTLVATGLVVLGFFFFDAATRTDNLIRASVRWLVGLTGWTPPSPVLNVTFGLLGVAVIVLGAGSYILGTRFKTAEMVDGGDTEPSNQEVAETEPAGEDAAETDVGEDVDRGDQ
jgi:hypothetical protein